jgi:cation diffusion facilitator family transporter
MSGCGCGTDEADKLEKSALIIMLGVNLTMFFVELITGVMAESTGLIADSLDMLADAIVYLLALLAVGKALSKKAKSAYLSGIFQIILGSTVVLEVIRKMVWGSEPEAKLIVSIGILALIANIYCLSIISKHKKSGVHMRASYIFTANDVIANTGVIIAGVFVHFLNSNIPDIIVGLIISLVVIKGGFSILKDSKNELENSSCA